MADGKNNFSGWRYGMKPAVRRATDNLRVVVEAKGGAPTRGGVAGPANVQPLAMSRAEWNAIRAIDPYAATPTPPVPSTRRPGPPVSPSGNLSNFNLSSRSYIAGFRFLLDAPIAIDRWWCNVVMEMPELGADRDGYASGDGGRLWGRIVAVDAATGLPKPASILAQERGVVGVTRYGQMRSEFDFSDIADWPAALYFQWPAVTLPAGTLLAFLLSNEHSDPGGVEPGNAYGNHCSVDTCEVPLAQMGPHGRNTLDPNAAGALFGLDPRECPLWSDDAGATWKFGDRFGQFAVGSGTGRMWNAQGYRIAGGRNVPHGYPFNIDESPRRGSVTWTASRDVTLTQAGGCSPDGSGVGVVTVANLDTGAKGQTPSLGSGSVRAALSAPIAVRVGQRYTVSSGGPVEWGEGHRKPIFGLGALEPFHFSSTGGPNAYSMASLFVQ